MIKKNESIELKSFPQQKINTRTVKASAFYLSKETLYKGQCDDNTVLYVIIDTFNTYEKYLNHTRHNNDI